MPILPTVLLCMVLGVGLSVVAFAVRERAFLAREVAAVVAGVERRTETTTEVQPSATMGAGSDLDELLNEVVQAENLKLAVLAVNELGGRAGLRRSRALLLSRGLPRIALLSGGGGAFVIAALGNFSRISLTIAAASAFSGLACSFASLAVNSGTRRLARKYVGIVDALAREVERQAGLEEQRLDRASDSSRAVI